MTLYRLVALLPLAFGAWCLTSLWQMVLFRTKTRRAPARIDRMLDNPLELFSVSSPEGEAYRQMLDAWAQRNAPGEVRGQSPADRIQYALTHGPAWPVVQFEVDGGKVWQVPLNPTMFGKLKAGDSLRVSYLPNNPNIISVETSEYIGFFTHVALLVAISTVCGTLGTMLWNK
ncbi:MAG TPA: hypothetical protein VGO93_13810 [Candidatus Xenobia bacterium]